MYLFILLAGFGGGALRGIIGFLKHQFSYKDVKFDVLYFLMTVIVSGVIGLLVSAVAEGTSFNFLGGGTLTPALAFIVGYAGGDFLENIYKLIIKK
jgi:hypothetical protein